MNFSKFKLSNVSLQKMVEAEIITEEQAKQISLKSLTRKPGKFARKIVSYSLNKSGTIKINSISFYGGEHSGDPYYFVAEITYESTNSVLSRWWNKNLKPLNINMNHFNY